MINITPNAMCTVIVTVDAEPHVMVELEAHARSGLSHFAEFDGFIGGALHMREDGTRLIQYLQWRDRAAHTACMNDPRWADLDSARQFMAYVHSGAVVMDVGIYDVVALSR